MAYVEEVIRDNPVVHNKMDDAASPMADATGNGKTMTPYAGSFNAFQYKNFPMTAGSDGSFRVYQDSGAGNPSGRTNGATNLSTPLTGDELAFSQEFWFHSYGNNWHETKSPIYYDYQFAVIHYTGFHIVHGCLQFGVSGECGSYSRGYERFFPTASVYYQMPTFFRSMHVVGVYTGTSIALYVDGEQVASKKLPKGFMRRLPNLARAFAVAGTQGSGGQMWVENKAEYNYALSSADIQNHFVKGNDHTDYITEFDNDGGDMFDITDDGLTRLYSKKFTAPDWANVEDSRNVKISETGVTLGYNQDAVAYLNGQDPYLNILSDDTSNNTFYSTNGWQAQNCTFFGDASGVPNSTNFTSGLYSAAFKKTDAGPSLMRGYTVANVTAGDTYRIHAQSVNTFRSTRLSVVWKNSGGGTVQTDYGTTITAAAGLTNFNTSELMVRAPIGAVTAEFGLETASADAVNNDTMWIDRFYVFRDLFYSNTANDGVYVYNNQGIVVPSAGSYINPSTFSIQGNFYVNTAVHLTGTEYVAWELKSGDASKILSLIINSTNNKLAIRYDYLDPYTNTWGSITTEHTTVATMGTGFKSLYTVVDQDVVTVFYTGSGTSISLNNTTPVPLAFDAQSTLTIGNNGSYSNGWSERMKFVNIRKTLEATKTFTDTVADVTFKLTKNGVFGIGNLSVSQFGYATYKLSVPDGGILSSRIVYSPQTRSTTGTSNIDGYHSIVRTSTDGSTWGGRIESDQSIPGFVNGTTTSNSYLWLRVELSTDESELVLSKIDRLEVDMFSAHRVNGSNHGRTLSVIGANPVFGHTDLHPASQYIYNGFSSKSTAALCMGAQPNTPANSIDGTGTGTLLGSAKTYKTVEMIVRVEAKAATQYLFYHEESGTPYSIYYDGTNFKYAGFNNVYVYAGGDKRGTIAVGGYDIPRYGVVYIVATTPNALTPTDADLGRFNFLTKSEANIGTGTINASIKMVGLYDYEMSATTIGRHFDTLRSRTSISHSDAAYTVTVTDTVNPPSAVTGTWGYKQISVDQDPDVA